MVAPKRRLQLDLVAGLPLYRRPNLRSALEVFGRDAAMRPSTWSMCERGGKDFDPDVVACAATGTPSIHVVQLVRKRAQANEAFLSIGEQPRVVVNTGSCDVTKDGPRYVRFADALAEAFRPDIGWVHASFDIDPPLLDPHSLAWWTMEARRWRFARLRSLGPGRVRDGDLPGSALGEPARGSMRQCAGRPL